MAKTKTKKKTTIKKGDKYKCGVCGLVVKVDDTCGCVDMCDIVCCDTHMKKVRKKK